MALFFRNGIIALIRALSHDEGVDTHGKLSPEGLNQAIASERKSFETYYRWLEESMPPLFFEEFTPEQMIALVHSLMGFSVQRYFAEIHFKDVSVVLCLEEINADLRILKNYTRMGIRSYQTFVSHGHIPLINKPLRVAILKFTQALVSASPERQKRIQELATMAQKSDALQYEIQHKEGVTQLILGWRNTPKHDFLYRVAALMAQHHLIMKRVTAAYVEQEHHESTLVMSIAIDGTQDLSPFIHDLSFLKSAPLPEILISLTYQFLLQNDPNLYSYLNVKDGFTRHPELSSELLYLFEKPKDYIDRKKNVLHLLDQLDTGNPTLDLRRKTILQTALLIIDAMLKTNYRMPNSPAFACKLDPSLFHLLPKDKFPEIPFALFYVQGPSFFGFHIRFRDLARGGIRTVLPFRKEQAEWEKQNIFSECYNLAYTQQKKNKDIPEGGAKGVIFVEPFDEIALESEIYKQEHSEQDLQAFQKDQRLSFLYQSQRSYVDAILQLVNDPVHPEYLYFGPDENMHNVMIEWIAARSKEVGYKPGIAFISSKPTYGINHKEFGVTSLGVNVYMHKTLLSLGIDPKRDPFTIKISGGPDGDVAGNQIYNLYRFYPNTAKLLAVTDVSGTLFDPNGLNLAAMATLFKNSQSICFYPPEHLSSGGFLLDLTTKRDQTAYSQQTLCYRKEGDTLEQHWLSGNETHHLYSHNLHSVVTDIFVPAGGRPRTLNASNWKQFLSQEGKPTSKAIVEGANLYLTPEARAELETLGVVIIKDSSANKGGVICSSLEVLAGLLLTEEEFLHEKPILMKEILAHIEEKAALEADLLLSYKGRAPLTLISERISEKINQLKDLYLHDTPTLEALLPTLLPLFRTKYKDRLLTHIPLIHQKALIAAHKASTSVYLNGL